MDGHSEYYTEWNVRHMKTYIVWYHLYVGSKKIIQTNIYAREKQSHRCRKQISCYQTGEGQVRGMRLRDTMYYL